MEPKYALKDIVLTAIILCIAVGLLGFFIWHTGLWGEVIVWVVIGLLLAGVGIRIYIWLAHHYLELRNKNIHSRVIITPHVSVYAHKEGHFTNFTAQLTPVQDEPLQFEQSSEINTPHDDWKQAKDRRAYCLREYDKKTWPQVATEIGENDSWCRRAVDRHTGRLTRGETIDARSW